LPALTQRFKQVLTKKQRVIAKRASEIIMPRIHRRTLRRVRSRRTRVFSDGTTAIRRWPTEGPRPIEHPFPGAKQFQEKRFGPSERPWTGYANCASRERARSRL